MHLCLFSNFSNCGDTSDLYFFKSVLRLHYKLTSILKSVFKLKKKKKIGTPDIFYISVFRYSESIALIVLELFMLTSLGGNVRV